MSMKEGAEFLKDQFGLNESIDSIKEGVNRTVLNFYHEQVQLKEGAKEFLETMKQAGVKITAATTSDRSIVEGALKTA